MVKNIIETTPTNHNTEILNIKCTTLQPENIVKYANKTPGNMQYNVSRLAQSQQ